MTQLSRRDSAELAEVKRLCYAGLDARVFREKVVARSTEHLRADAAAFAILDPETGFLVSTLAVNCSEAHFEEFAARAYLRSAAADPGLLASGNRRVGLLEQLAPPAEGGRDPALEVLLANGLGHEVQVSLAAGGKGWGHLVFDREPENGAFTQGEVAWLERLVPHLLAGLRASLNREELDAKPGSGVGVVMLSADGRIELANGVAERLLASSAIFGRRAEFGALRLLLKLLVRSLGDEEYELVPALHVIDEATGERYRLGAERVTGSDGLARGLILITPARPAEGAEALARLGLSRREAEVALAVVRGQKTSQVAAQLRISPHTVNHHLRHVFEKLGVNSRRELAALAFGMVG